MAYNDFFNPYPQNGYPINGYPQQPNNIMQNGYFNSNPIQNQTNRNYNPQTSFSDNRQMQVLTPYCRVVNNENEILPKEIPMDGHVSYFCSSDGTCIYAKAWGANGLINTIKYIPEEPINNQSESVNNSSEKDILNKLDSINSKLDELFNRKFSKVQYKSQNSSTEEESK